MIASVGKQLNLQLFTAMTHIAIFGRERPIIDLQYTSQPKGTRVQGLLVSPQNSQNLQNWVAWCQRGTSSRIDQQERTIAENQCLIKLLPYEPVSVQQAHFVISQSRASASRYIWSCLPMNTGENEDAEDFQIMRFCIWKGQQSLFVFPKFSGMCIIQQLMLTWKMTLN